MSDPSLKVLTTKNLLYLARTAAGSDLFRHVYATNAHNKEVDTLEDGALSCSYVVSGLLSMLGLIDHAHATVTTTLQKMQEAGWKQTTELGSGMVVHWPAGQDGKDHIGFYLGDEQYMSNSTLEHQPVIHSRSLFDGRVPDAYYTHETLSV